MKMRSLKVVFEIRMGRLDRRYLQSSPWPHRNPTRTLALFRHVSKIAGGPITGGNSHYPNAQQSSNSQSSKGR